MKSKISTVLMLTFLAAFNSLPSDALAQGTAFTYQGRLNSSGTPANGSYDVAFTLFETNVTGSAFAGPVTNTAVGVTNGLFTTRVDFGNVFTGGSNWLEIAVSASGANAFITLVPRQQLTPVPYAVTAANVSGTVAASSISGTLPLAQLPPGVVTNGASGVNFSGTFSGNGSGLTSVPLSVLGTFTTTNVVAWGDNNSGQTSVPGGLTNVTAVAAGTGHSLALLGNGTVVAWGNNAYGQTNIPGGLTNVTAVAAGGYFSLALKSNGTVVGWGDNSLGQTNIPVGLTNVTAVGGGAYYGLALKSNGTVIGWGDDSFGETNIPAGLTNVTAIAAGGLHALALKSNGTVVAWGYNGSGETNVPSSLTNVTAIGAGYYHSLAVKSNGTVVGWGYNSDGEINIPAGLTNAVSVVGGVYHSLALKSDGTVVGWGSAVYGQSYVPFGLTNVMAIGPGSLAYHSLAVDRQVNAAALAANGAVSSVTQASLGTATAYTPTIGNGSANFSMTTQSGYYAKVANLVYFEAQVIWNGKGSATSGNVVVSLPVPVVSPRAVFSLGYISGITSTYQIVPIASATANFVAFYNTSPGGLQTTSCANSGEIQVSGWYRWQ